MFSTKFVGCLLALLLAVAGCTVGPDYTRPELVLPAEWLADEAAAADSAALSAWWTTFNDPVLSGLIEQADQGNLDLKSALARIDQARALRAYAAGENWPAVDAVGSYTRSRASENGLGLAAGEQSLYSAGFDAAWEIDLFGRIRRSVEAADATLAQSVADYHAVRVSLMAEIAAAYTDLRTSQARIGYAQANIDVQKKTLDLVKNRFDLQIAPALDVAQARLILANTESEIPSLRIAESAALNRLAVLTGTTPHQLRDTLLQAAPVPQTTTVLAAGLPAELLRRRPDIRSAERAVAAQTARIGAAQALRYPMFSLSGMMNFQATHISDVGDWDSRAFAFGPDVRWNLFDGNRIKSLTAAEEALTRQYIAAYEATVLRAVEETENAMIGYAQELNRAAALRRSVDAARESLGMVENLYLNGLTDFQNVLDTQRSLTAQEDRLAVSEGQIVRQVIAMYKAVGGGWEAESLDAE